jgi:hypothetical protein
MSSDHSTGHYIDEEEKSGNGCSSLFFVYKIYKKEKAPRGY